MGILHIYTTSITLHQNIFQQCLEHHEYLSLTYVLSVGGKVSAGQLLPTYTHTDSLANVKMMRILHLKHKVSRFVKVCGFFLEDNSDECITQTYDLFDQTWMPAV